MIDVDVLIPVLGRPERAGPLVESLAVSARYATVRAYFLCSPGDTAQIAAARAANDHGIPCFVTVVEWEPGAGDYARKMNQGVAESSGEFFFYAADDLLFHPGWIERAAAKHLETGACVVGTNDLGNRSVTAGLHSTHTLVSRRYVECGTIDDPTRLLHEGYDHNFVDTEFVATAVARETFAHATDAIVEHLHPNWGKASQDATYRKGHARFGEDRALYDQRAALWTP